MDPSNPTPDPRLLDRAKRKAQRRNRRRFVPDGRTQDARRQKAHELALVRALGPLPYSRLPVWQRDLIDAAVIASHHIALDRAALARGESVDQEASQRWVGVASRAYESLGLTGEGAKLRAQADAEAARDAELRRVGIDPDKLRRP